MIADYHIHTKLCGHADGEMEDYLAKGISSGLAEMGFSDHAPMPMEQDKKWRMKEDELAGYVDDVLALQKKASIPVRLGIEADYIPGMEDYIKKLTHAYPFDYVLGSVHYIRGWGFDNPDYAGDFDNRDIDEVYAEYFLLLTEAVLSGLFDAIAHPDLVKKFGHFPTLDMAVLASPFLDAMKEKGLCLEINTAGLRKPVGEIYPGPRLLELAAERDIPVILGSDAHHPSEVAWEFTSALKAIKGNGLKLAFFNNRNQKPA